MRKLNLLEKLKNRNLAFISLISIFIMLLIQSALLIFSKIPNTEGLGQMDVIFRTTMSSIFGFFMSSNALNGKMSDNKTKSEDVKKIGFTENNNNSEVQLSLAKDSEKNKAIDTIKKDDNSPIKVTVEERFEGNLLIIFLTTISIFCLIAMMIVRNFSHMVTNSSYALVTMSLYRDLISSSVGAIIGIAQSRSK